MVHCCLAFSRIEVCGIVSKLALQADLWYTRGIILFGSGGTANTPLPELHLYRRRANGHSTHFYPALQALPSCFPLQTRRKTIMSAPKDPQRYEEWRQKIIEARKRQPPTFQNKTHSPEARAKISAAKKGNKNMLGHKHTPESLAKMSASHKGYKTSDETKAKLSITSKRPLSDEAKAKISASHRGLGHTDETKAKLSAIVKAHFESLSPEEQVAYIEKRLRTGNNKNTDLEVYIAKILDRWNIKYEQQKRIGRYYADFLLPDQMIVLEAQGCFWHGCPQCGWDGEAHAEKIAHDKKRTNFLVGRGYTVIILWQHELQPLMREDKFTKE